MVNREDASMPTVPQQTHQRFPINDSFFAQELVNLSSRKFPYLDSLIVLGVCFGKLQIPGFHHVHLFGQKAGTGIKGEEPLQRARTIAGFFQQFAPGRTNDALVGLHGSRNEFPHMFPGRVAKLANQNDAPIGKSGDHDNRPMVDHNFTESFNASGLNHAIKTYANHSPFINSLTFEDANLGSYGGNSTLLTLRRETSRGVCFNESSPAEQGSWLVRLR
jgi:hypothetical protein